MKAITLAAALTTLALTLAPAFAMASPNTTLSPRNFDCATLTDSQVTKLEHEMSSDNLKDLAKTCDEQASTFQKIAQEGQTNLPQKDVSALYEKAANAHVRVASFTNEALMK